MISDNSNIFKQKPEDFLDTHIRPGLWNFQIAFGKSIRNSNLIQTLLPNIQNIPKLSFKYKQSDIEWSAICLKHLQTTFQHSLERFDSRLGLHGFLHSPLRGSRPNSFGHVYRHSQSAAKRRDVMGADQIGHIHLRLRKSQVMLHWCFFSRNAAISCGNSNSPGWRKKDFELLKLRACQTPTPNTLVSTISPSQTPCDSRPSRFHLSHCKASEKIAVRLSRCLLKLNPLCSGCAKYRCSYGCKKYCEPWSFG